MIDADTEQAVALFFEHFGAPDHSGLAALHQLARAFANLLTAAGKKKNSLKSIEGEDIQFGQTKL